MSPSLHLSSEQEERFPFLKDAPTEGSYSKTVKLKHKPLGFEVRNVRCLRCGSWGHQSGDRECSMRDYNPHDAARQKREDPMAYISGSLQIEKQKLILKQALVDRPANVEDFVDDGDEEGESDPEAEFLATLTSKEKKKLLRRLQELEGNIPAPSTSIATAAHRPEDSRADLKRGRKY
jgi:CBF1 interacting corepressor